MSLRHPSNFRVRSGYGLSRDEQWQLEAFLSKFRVDMDGLTANLLDLSRRPNWTVAVEYDVLHCAYRIQAWHRKSNWAWAYMFAAHEELMHYAGELPIPLPFPEPKETNLTVMEHLQRAERLLDQQIAKGNPSEV